MSIHDYPAPIAVLLRSDEEGGWATGSATARGYGPCVPLCGMEPVTRAAWITAHGRRAATADEYAAFVEERRARELPQVCVTQADLDAVTASGDFSDGFSLGGWNTFCPGESVASVCRVLTQHYWQ